MALDFTAELAGTAVEDFNFTPALDLTMVVVSDYETGEKSYKDEILLLKSLAEQGVWAPYKIVIAESTANQNIAPPQDLFDQGLQVELVYRDAHTSCALKNAALDHVTTEWVVSIEADTVPEPGWLDAITKAVASHPDCSIFFGRTYYGEETIWRRTCNLLERSFDDRGSDGPTNHISNNAALYRTELAKAFPYKHAATQFLSARIRLDALHKHGHRAYFVSGAVARHAVGDAGFTWDVYRNTGYSDMKVRPNCNACYLPRAIVGRFLRDLRHAQRVGGRYMKLRDWPMWITMVIFARFAHLRGLVEGLGNPDCLHGSRFR
ncbi:MAG: glycosyltransferase family A protein [Pseudomonadota bacterium]